MAKPILIIALTFATCLFCFAVDASEIIKIKGNRFLIQLDGETVRVGEQLNVVDSNGNKRGVVEITKFNETKALAKIKSGTVDVGMKLTKRTGLVLNDSATSLKSEIASTNNYDLRVNPIGLVLGAVDLNFDVKITDNLTIGLQGTYLHATLPASGIFTSDYDVTAYGVGVRGNWFYNGAFKDGYYLAPSLEYLSVNVKTADAVGSATGTASGLMATGLIGYGWFWDHFNIMLGGGYGTVLGASSITIKDSAGNREIISANLSGIALEFSMGWAF